MRTQRRVLRPVGRFPRRIALGLGIASIVAWMVPTLEASPPPPETRFWPLAFRLAPMVADTESVLAHLRVYQEEGRFPSANTCANCHPDHFREWSVSSHSYAQLSPVFNAMAAKISKLTNGTNGDFCIRCHTQVGMNLGEPEFMTNMDRHPTSREGITCIVCHRLDRPSGKVSGRLAIVEGDIFDPVFGPTGNAELKRNTVDLMFGPIRLRSWDHHEVDMARTAATLPAGIRLTDHVSLGVLTASFPLEIVQAVLARTGRESQRERELPAHVMVYYAIALALYADASTRETLRCLLEGVRWLGDPAVEREPTSRSGISRARTRLGAEPLEVLYREVVTSVAVQGTPGAWYRGWRVMSLDGTTLDVSDTQANARAFGRPASSRGVNTTGAFPQLRLVGLLENGTHVITGAEFGPYGTSENELASTVLPRLTGAMLCLADRGFLSFDLWRSVLPTGAALVWRASSTFSLPVLEPLADGSYRSELRWNYFCKSSDRSPIPVRVIEYTLVGVPQAEASYRLVTNILEPERAPAEELAALYHERWEMETAFDEFKTHLRGSNRVLRSKTPELVRQEAWGFLLAHFAIRALMHEAALGALPRARDPDTLSFTHALRVARRTLPHVAAISPSGSRTAGRGSPAYPPGGEGRGRELQPRTRRPPRRQAEDE